MTYTQLFMYNVAIIHLTDAYATLNVQNCLPEFKKKCLLLHHPVNGLDFFHCMLVNEF